MTRWVDGLEEEAREVLPPSVHRYYSQGSADEFTVGEAVAAWKALRFRPHILVDVSSIDLATSALGVPLPSPIAIAPSSLQMHAHPDGEVEMGRGAAAARTLMCVSSNSGQPFADIAAASGPWWVQAYVLRDRGLTQAMLERAVAAGAQAVVLTADTPVVAAKRDLGDSVWGVTPDVFLHANEDLEGVSHTAIDKATDLSAADIAWLRDVTSLPVVVKGVLRPDDAKIAVDGGASAVWVSNHGGRQLDRSIPTAVALGPVADAVGDTAEVFVDGGIRDGRDVLAALALGARCAFVGRPPLWALATRGAQGIADLLALLTEELAEAMTLAGAPSVHDVPADLVVSPVSPRRPSEQR
jgi:4-hydroxymandelate oxidase